MKLRRAIVAAVAICAVLAIAATAAARTPLHGGLKIRVVRQSDHNAQVPSNWQILHCLGGYRSTARRDWADYYFTGYHGNHLDTGCRSAASNGLEIAKLEHGRWTAVTGFDGAAAPCYVKSYPGQPRMPWAVVDDLFRIHCPTHKF